MRDLVGNWVVRRGLSLGVVVMLGCGGGQSDKAPATAEPAAPHVAEEKPAQAPPSEAAAAKPAEPLSDKASDPSFMLQLKPAGPYATGKLGTVVLDLEPREPYHVNQEYPMSVSVSAKDGITLPKAELQKGDAAEYTEKRARFEVPFTPTAAGEHQIEAHVRFAVCTPETCVPDERKLALAVPVE